MRLSDASICSALNALPETRQLFDAFLGKVSTIHHALAVYNVTHADALNIQSPTGRSRLALVESFESRSGSTNDNLPQSGTLLDDESFIDLQVGERLQVCCSPILLL
jgi:hypothetical protein